MATPTGLPVREAIRRKLYGSDTSFPDDMAVEAYACLLLLAGLKIRSPRRYL